MCTAHSTHDLVDEIPKQTSSRQLSGHRRPATQVRRKPIRAVLKESRSERLQILKVPAALAPVLRFLESLKGL